jgi:hypothetical protein
MVHDVQLDIADRSICFSSYRSRAGERSTNPASLRERGNLFARSSIWLVARSAARSPSTFHVIGLSRVPWLGSVSDCLPGVS